MTTTNFDQEQRQLLDTASAQALNSINEKLRQDKTPVLNHLHALQEISEIYPNNMPLTALISRIHSGISTVLLQKEDSI